MRVRERLVGGGMAVWACKCATVSRRRVSHLAPADLVPCCTFELAWSPLWLPPVAVAARMPPAVLLVINLRIRAAADCCCGSSSSLLLPDSVKPAAQRGVQNSRGFVPPEAERIRAHRPELDGTTRLTETRGTGHGRTAEREVASGASDKTTRKTRI